MFEVNSFNFTNQGLIVENLSSPEGSTFISNLLGNSNLSEIEQIFQHSQQTEELLKLSNILLSARTQDGTKPAFKPYLEQLVFKIVLDEAIDVETKVEFVERLVASTPALVSASCETAALSALLGVKLSPRTMQGFVTFMNTRPNMSARHLPLICAAVRQHLDFILTNGDQEQNVLICDVIQHLANLTKKRKDDWGNVAPYLVADLLNTNLALDDQKLKQILTVAAHNLLDICSTHSPEYISANMPPATNEMFKLVLQDYKTNHKFTGRHT